MYRISGQVTQSGFPLEDAEIIVIDHERNRIDGTERTDENGRYTIERDEQLIVDIMVRSMIDERWESDVPYIGATLEYVEEGE